MISYPVSFSHGTSSKMNFFELEPADISSLNDADLRNLVARLCEAELIQQGIPPSVVTWGGAQEAPDGGLDVNVKCPAKISNPNFVPRNSTGFQVKKHSMGKSACKKEMEEAGNPKAVLADLAAQKGAYIIVSGKDDCSEKMLSDRLAGMKEAVAALQEKNELHLDFYGRDRLAAWLRRHPSVALWVRSRLGKPLSGWAPFGRWAATPHHQEDNFLMDEHPCVIDVNSTSKEPKAISEGIELTRDRLRKLGSTVRITGLSGVGKTRFAQALFESDVGENPLPASDVIYADLGNNLNPTASELVTYLIAHDFAAYLVLDNCPPDVHRNLQKQVAGGNAKLRLLTIEYDISQDKPEETEVIQIEPSSVKTVSKLVQKRFSELDGVNADRIADFAGGNARVALALASRVKADETLSSFSDEDLFRRLFSQRKGESSELLRGAEILALVYSFNVSAVENSDELTVLGRISGMSRQELRSHQAELLRRQIAQKRGNWRAVLPHALANRLAKRALEEISLEEINAELLKPENLRLLQSCAHRLGYLHDFDPARDLAFSWLKPDGPLSNISSCAQEHLIVLDYIAPVFPEVILHAIEAASEIPGFASRENPRFIQFVSLLLHFAYEDRIFDRASDILLKFAETEKLGEKHDSIVSRMKQLFSLHLSGTEATPVRRQTFVKKMFNSGNSRHREIAEEILDSAFESRHWTSFASFHFGARQRGFGWVPKTQDEGMAWYLGYIQVLQEVLDSNLPNQKSAKAVLAKNFRQLWAFPGCFDLIEKIIQKHGQNGAWLEMWMCLKTNLAFNRDQCTPQLLARIEALEKITAPADFNSEIEAYAFTNPWDHVRYNGKSFQDESDEIYEKVLKLGELLALQPEHINSLGDRLWQVRVQPLMWLGKGLGVGAIDKLRIFKLLIDSFLRCHDTLSKNVLVLEGYVGSAYLHDPVFGRQILEQALEFSELKPNIVSLLLSAPIDSWVIEKILQLANSGEVEAKQFEQISYGRLHEKIPENEMAMLLEAINRLNQGYFSSIKIMAMRLFEKEKYGYTPSLEVCAAARTALSQLVNAQRDDLKQAQLHGIDRVLEECLGTSAPEDEIKNIISLLCKSIGEYRIYSYDMPKIIVALVKTHLEWFLDEVFDGSKNEAALAYLMFKDRLFRERPTLNEAPLQRLLAWCGNDQSRIEKTAKAVHPYSTVDPEDVLDEPRKLVLSKHILSLLDRAQDKLAIVQIIFDNTSPSGWSGSLANILEVRLLAFSDLLKHSNPKIHEAVKAKVALLESRIRTERDREAAENNEREQRFE